MLIFRTSLKPVIGQRVRRTAPHETIPVGILGKIVVLDVNSLKFCVAMDNGEYCEWTDLDRWTPVGLEVA